MILVSAMAVNAIAETFSVDQKTQTQINAEAEDWMDNIPDGMMDRLSDAVEHATHGFYNEINYFRNFADTTGIKNYKVEVKDFKGGEGLNIPMRLYTSKTNKSGNNPLLIYFHGGGWTLGSINTTDKYCRALASEGNVTVVSVEYPLAPENPYPSALTTGCEAVKYLIKNSNSLGFAPDLISLGGDGAGGNLALNIYESLPADIKIKSLVLYYPMIKSEGQLEPTDKRKYGRGYGFDSRLWESFISTYGGKALSFTKPLPPTLLITAGRDIIVSQEKEFSLRQPQVKYLELTSALHGFITDGQQKTAFNTAVRLTDLFLMDKK